MGASDLNMAGAVALSKSSTTHDDATYSTHWTTSNTYYWPKAVNLDFWAWAPKTAIDAAVNGTSKVKITDFSIDSSSDNPTITFKYDLGAGVSTNSKDKNSTDATEMPDLMFASSRGLSKDSKDLVNGGCVPLDFKHALSAVKFNITSTTKGYIKSISLVDVSRNGICICDPAADENEFDWTVTEDKGTYLHYFNTGSNKTTTTNEYGLYPTDPEDSKYTQNASAVFMMIPQEITTKSRAIQVVMVEDENDPVSCVRTFTGYIPAITWTAGKTYVYNIVIGGDVQVTVDDTMISTVKSNVKIANTGSLKAYIRAAIVANWVDGNGKIVNVKWDEETSGVFTGLPTETSTGGWRKGADGYYYYTKQVPPQSYTSEKLFDTYEVYKCPGYPSAHLVMNIVVQAIHAETLAADSFALQETYNWGYLKTKNASTGKETVSRVTLTTDVDKFTTTTSNGQ